MLLNSNKTDKDDDKFILYKTVNNTDSLEVFVLCIFFFLLIRAKSTCLCEKLKLYNRVS